MSKQKKKQGEKKTAKDFGKKEKMLNYTCQTYHLTRPKKVGATMALIRKCQPQTIEEWEVSYFKQAFTEEENSSKITEESLKELGKQLYTKITEVVKPEWTQAFESITIDDCISYIKDVTINRTYDGYLCEKSVISDLTKDLPELRFDESNPKLDHAGNIDYIIKVGEGEQAIGIQIKPTSARTILGAGPLMKRTESSFQDFKEQYKGEVFIVFTSKNKIYKKEEVIKEIRQEIDRLSKEEGPKQSGRK